MSPNEELQEHAHHAHDSFDKSVAVTMAIIAAILATVSVAAHVFSNEELLEQQKASDLWAEYQGKSGRRYASEIARDTFRAMQTGASAVELADKYEREVERYKKDGEELQTEARKLEAESKLKGRQALRMDMGEVFLEIGIVFASLAILSKRRPIWYLAMASAAVGLGISLTAVFVK